MRHLYGDLMVNLVKKLGLRKLLLDNRETNHPGLAALLIDMKGDDINKLYRISQDEYSYFHDAKEYAAHDKDLIIDSQIQMIRYFTRTNVPVIDINIGSDNTAKLLRKELRKSVYVQKFDKYGYNGFGFGCKYFFEFYKDGYLINILNDLHVDHVFLMGINASICVYETAIGGIRSGFNVSTASTVIADTFGLLKLYTFKDKRKADYVSAGVNFYSTHDEFIRTLRP
jgi:hypothetical protein